MTIRSARLTDFAHLETFVWQAIFPAFDVDGLSANQRAENDALVENARSEVAEVLDLDHFGVFVAIDPKTRSLAGYVIADARPRAYAEIKRLIVKRTYHGKGVGELLLDEATEFIGRDRAVSLAVRHYNQRAIAFFAKHGFTDTGEFTGNHAINRTLMLREAHEAVAPTDASAVEASTESFGFDFPSASDEPVFEALPDYNLASEETPLFETGANALRTVNPEDVEPEETSLSEEQLSVLEAFIAKARKQKRKEGLTPANTVKPKPAARVIKPRPPQSAASAKSDKPAFDRSKITFEVDYGEPPERTIAAPVAKQTERPARKASFAFDFAPAREEAAASEHVVAPSSGSTTGQFVPENSGNLSLEAEPAPTTVRAPSVAIPASKETKTKVCPDCTSVLPVAARFCFVCGHPQQPEGEPTGDSTIGDQPEGEEAEELLLEELPPLPGDSVLTNNENLKGEELEEVLELQDDVAGSQASKEDSTGSSSATDVPPVSVSELRLAFRNHLQNRVLAYFGDRKLKKYLSLLDTDTAFQQVRDGSLNSLAGWLQNQPDADLARTRRQNTFADLTEYFIVETAADLSGNVLPQRLLRHQSVDWRTADIFRLVMDYLDFDAESESIHTDFVTMPARALRNATKSFLHAAKDERVFFICDQSLISQAKNGFAVTDAGIYWKNVLQPAGASTFTTMREARLEQGHVIIDGQFFDAGGRLNLKVAVLLDKLRRMR